MNNNKSIKCKECAYHYINDIENPIGKEWCLLEKCVKSEKVDYRLQIREEQIKHIKL